jgi:hypothetical protein
MELKATKCIWVTQHYSTNLQQKAMCKKAPKKYASSSSPNSRPAKLNITPPIDLPPVPSPLPHPPPPGSMHAHRRNAVLCARHCTWPMVNELRPRFMRVIREVIKAQPLARGRTKFKNKNGKRQPNTPSSTPRCAPRQHSKGSLLAAPRCVLPSLRVTCCRRCLSPTYLQRPDAGRTRGPSSHKPKR